MIWQYNIGPADGFSSPTHTTLYGNVLKIYISVPHCVKGGVLWKTKRMVEYNFRVDKWVELSPPADWNFKYSCHEVLNTFLFTCWTFNWKYLVYDIWLLGMHWKPQAIFLTQCHHLPKSHHVCDVLCIQCQRYINCNTTSRERKCFILIRWPLEQWCRISMLVKLLSIYRPVLLYIKYICIIISNNSRYSHTCGSITYISHYSGTSAMNILPWNKNVPSHEILPFRTIQMKFNLQWGRTILLDPWIKRNLKAWDLPIVSRRLYFCWRSLDEIEE